MKALLLVIISCLLAAQPLRADDSVPSPESMTDSVRFTPQQLIVPGALITVGALGVGVKPFVKARKWINKEAGVHRLGSADDYVRFVPLAGYELLDFAGVKSRRPFVDRVITGASATVIMVALTMGTKWAVSEQRPGSDEMNSFPSGHAAVAFMGAELLRQGYDPWVGAAGYVVAGGIGVIRILKGCHWLNDVLAGAGIGIFSARAAEWLLPFWRRTLSLDRRPGEAAIVVPGWSPADRALTLNASFTF